MKVTAYDIGICASFNCPQCKGPITPSYRYCLHCGVDLQWGEDAYNLYVHRLGGKVIRKFVRKRDRMRGDFVYISDAELAEQGIDDKFRMGYEIEYNGECRLILAISPDGIMIDTRARK